MKRAIVVGATSGIGRELAKLLSQAGYIVGVMGRREDLLASLQAELPGPSFSERIDLVEAQQSIATLERLAAKLGGLDLLVISSGVGFINPDLAWEPERDTLAVNVTGFAAAAGFAMRLFMQQGSGHLVGISSVAAYRGGGAAPAYNASKAFVSNYLEGLRQKAFKAGLPITITDVKPGFVDTAMAKGEDLIWVAPVEKAARQIHAAIERREPRVIVTRRWRLIAGLLRVLPFSLYARLG